MKMFLQGFEQCVLAQGFTALLLEGLKHLGAFRHATQVMVLKVPVQELQYFKFDRGYLPVVDELGRA
jgi:hypothetical protein